jgi:hypothetical protein
MLHRLAFASPRVQLIAEDLGNSLYGKVFQSVTAERPVFITSLPRAGTTALLNALAGLPSFATHLYRDMPFVMAPVLWSRLSGRFQKASVATERAHGDGLSVGYDSPEAFEEIIWRCFWPDHFAADHIRLWTRADLSEEARSFLQRHFRKIIALRRGSEAQGVRYLSKNNANIARLDLLHAMFPDATVLVPVRAPLAQAASLLRQHQRFLVVHREDDFARRYMEDIGHYEFGLLHRPIRFDGFEELATGLSPDDLDYWLAYWIAAFEHVAAEPAPVTLIPYDALSRGEPGSLESLLSALDLGTDSADPIRSVLKPPPPLSETVAAHRSALRDRAEALVARLLAKATPA